MLEKQFSELSIVPFPHVLMKWPREHPPLGATTEHERHRLYERYSHKGWPLVGRDSWTPAGPVILCEWWSAGHDVGLPSDRGVWASTQEHLRQLIVLMDEAAFTILPEQLQIAREIPDPVTRWAVALHELFQPAPQCVVLKAEQWPHVQPPVERYAIPPHCEGDATLTLDYTQRAFISKKLRSLVLSDYLPFGLIGVLVDALPSRHPNVEYSIIHSLPLACARVCGMLAGPDSLKSGTNTRHQVTEVTTANPGTSDPGSKLETPEFLLDMTEPRLKNWIRAQVKAERKTALVDDILIAAYKTQGSYRKAAKFLSEETGEKITKERVGNAVTRAGGPDAVLRNENSDSAIRDDVSLQRDKEGNILIHAKPKPPE